MKLALVSAIVFTMPSTLSAQAVQGRLIGRETQAPVRGGTVHLMAADSQVVAQSLTDSTGTFVLQAPRAGSYWLLGSAPGYETSETDRFDLGAQGMRVSFVIGRAAFVLDTVTATTAGREDRLWYGGYYQRLRENRGARFITKEQIRRQQIVAFADVLRMIPSLEVQIGPASDFSDSRTLRVRLRHPTSIRSQCWSTFYLNGMRVEAESVQNLEPAEIEGIEVYTSAAVPAQFNSSMGSACGVIVVWTTVRG